jgi:peptide/nickel transport system substrate-binding protein
MKLRLLVPILAVATASLAACTSSGTPSGNKNTGAQSTHAAGHQEVTVRIGGDWPTLDPYQTSGNINTDIIDSGLFDRLVSLAPDGKTVVPYLATKWDVTPTKLVFTVRDGVTCSDGAKLDAAAIAGSLKYLASQPEAKLLLGAGPYTVTNDASTVTIELGKPYSDALLKLTDAHASIICPAGIDIFKGKDTTKVVGSGPYTLDEAVHSDHLKLTAREGWSWGTNGESTARDGFPSGMTIHVVADESTAANELLTGQLDVASITGPDVARLIANKDLSHMTFGGQYLSNLVFNPKNAALQDQAVRKAISQAIDTKAFMQADTGGYGTTSASFFAPKATCYDSAVESLVTPPSVDTAKATLEADGYTLQGGKQTKDGKALSFTMVTTTQNFSAAGQEYIAQTLGDVGIEVKIKSVDASTYGSLLVAGNYDIAQQLLSGGGPAPGDYILYMTGPSFADGGGNTSINDEEVNALVQDAFAAGPDTQCAAWAKVQQAVISKNEVLPLDQQEKQYFLRDGVRMDAYTMLHLDTITR